MNTRRPLAVTVAAGLLALLSLSNVALSLVPAFTEGVPAFVVYGSAVLGGLGLAAAYGLWTLRRWSVWLAMVLSVLNILSAAPGIAFAPTTGLFVSALVTVAGYALIVALVALPVSRRSYV